MICLTSEFTGTLFSNQLFLFPFPQFIATELVTKCPCSLPRHKTFARQPPFVVLKQFPANFLYQTEFFLQVQKTIPQEENQQIATNRRETNLFQCKEKQCMIKTLEILLWQNYMCNLENLKLQVTHVIDKIITASYILKSHQEINNLLSCFSRKTIWKKKVLISGFLTLVECIYLN